MSRRKRHVDVEIVNLAIGNGSPAERMRAEAPQVYSRELVELVFVRPYARIAHVVDAGIAKRQTASVYLKELCTVGLLQERKAGREKLFINPAFMDLLNSE